MKNVNIFVFIPKQFVLIQVMKIATYSLFSLIFPEKYFKKSMGFTHEILFTFCKEVSANRFLLPYIYTLHTLG